MIATAGFVPSSDFIRAIDYAYRNHVDGRAAWEEGLNLRAADWNSQPLDPGGRATEDGAR